MLRLIGFLALLACNLGWSEDVAIIAAAQEYPNKIKPLKGPYKDAARANQVFSKLGFSTIVLSNGKGTKKAILDSISQLALRQVDRFVFYFAGHGTSNPFAILPEDTMPKDRSTLLEAKDLRDAIAKKFRATSKTVILDSCFSGGMAKAVQNGDVSAERYFNMEIQAKGVITASDYDKAFLGEGVDFGICYITATLPAQPAEEATFGAEGMRGVFSYYFFEELEKSISSSSGKSGVNIELPDLAEIRTDVASAMQTRKTGQRPDINPKSYLQQPPFGQKKSQVPMPSPSIVRTLLSVERLSQSPKLRIRPNDAVVHVGQQCSLSVDSANTNEDQLVVILGQRGDRVYRVSPIGANELNLIVESNYQLSFTEAGTETLTLFLFASDVKGSERAKGFCSFFPSANTNDVPLRIAPQAQRADRGMAPLTFEEAAKGILYKEQVSIGVKATLIGSELELTPELTGLLRTCLLSSTDLFFRQLGKEMIRGTMGQRLVRQLRSRATSNEALAPILLFMTNRVLQRTNTQSWLTLEERLTYGQLVNEMRATNDELQSSCIGNLEGPAIRNTWLANSQLLIAKLRNQIKAHSPGSNQ